MATVRLLSVLLVFCLSCVVHVPLLNQRKLQATADKPAGATALSPVRKIEDEPTGATALTPENSEVMDLTPCSSMEQLTLCSSSAEEEENEEEMLSLPPFVPVSEKVLVPPLPPLLPPLPPLEPVGGKVEFPFQLPPLTINVRFDVLANCCQRKNEMTLVCCLLLSVLLQNSPVDKGCAINPPPE